MKAIDFMPGQTTLLAEDQEEYFNLPVIRIIYNDGTHAFISAWVANFWDKVKILLGMPVYLAVLTDQKSPPVLVTTLKSDVGIDDFEKLHKEKK